MDVERAWPFFERACREAGLARSLHAVAAALWETASESRPAHHHRHHSPGRWAILEPRLVAELRRGLSIKLAAAKVGVPHSSVRGRMASDLDFASRLEVARLAGVAKVHGYVIERAEKGSDTAAIKLLEYSGEPEYLPRLKIQEPDEADVLRSKAWARIGTRLTALLCPSCAARLAEELGS